MSLSSRDKKVVIVLVPLLIVGAFLFLVMKPKRQEAAKAAKALEQQRERRDQAVAREQQLRLAKQSFAADYTTVVRLGKAVPTDVDMPSMLVQLERAAQGTGIEFGSIMPGARIPAAGGAPASPPQSGSSSSAQPVDAGGAAAQSGPGKATETANNAAAGANQNAAATENASPETDTQTSTSSGKGGVPVGGGSTEQGGGDGDAGVPGLDTVPLDLTFTGNFFELADLFNRLKRFVRVANQELNVKGRLMTIDSFNFSSDESFPKIEAEMKARIFLAPEGQGATAGATPSGPGAGGSSAAGASPAQSAPSSTPTAAATGAAAP